METIDPPIYEEWRKEVQKAMWCIHQYCAFKNKLMRIFVKAG